MKEYKLTINGNEYEVAIESVVGNTAEVTVNGIRHSVEIAGEPAPAPQAAPVQSAPAAAATVSTPASAGGRKITSPLPGVIIDICVAPGQAVKTGQKVAVLEAMKMENEILAECDGTVSAVHAAKGDSVMEGAEIVTLG